MSEDVHAAVIELRARLARDAACTCDVGLDGVQRARATLRAINDAVCDDAGVRSELDAVGRETLRDVLAVLAAACPACAAP